MGDQFDNKFTWVIKNVPFSQSKEICSDVFVIGGCSWRVVAYYCDGNECLSLSLAVADTEYLPSGWRRHAEFSFTILNQISEEFSQLEDIFLDLTETQEWFDRKTPVCGCASSFPSFPLGKLNAKYGGFLLNGQVKIVAQVTVIEAIGNFWLPLSKIKLNKIEREETIDVHGFQITPSKVEFVRHIFEKHPDLAVDFIGTDAHPCLQARVIYILIDLIKTLRKPLRSISRPCLVRANHALEFMINCGLKVGWLEKKLKEVTVKKAKIEGRRRKSKAQMSAAL